MSHILRRLLKPLAFYRPIPHTRDMSKIAYSELSTTTELGAVCVPCSEYKGMVDCTECGSTFCLFCSDFGCEDCGAEIDYSA